MSLSEKDPFLIFKENLDTKSVALEIEVKCFKSVFPMVASKMNAGHILLSFGSRGQVA